MVQKRPDHRRSCAAEKRSYRYTKSSPRPFGPERNSRQNRKDKNTPAIATYYAIHEGESAIREFATIVWMDSGDMINMVEAKFFGVAKDMRAYTRSLAV